MVIFIEDGIVKWKQASHDFPFQYLVINSKVPVYSIAGDYFNNQTIETKPEKVNAIEWFPEIPKLNLNRNGSYGSNVLKLQKMALYLVFGAFNHSRLALAIVPAATANARL